MEIVLDDIKYFKNVLYDNLQKKFIEEKGYHENSIMNVEVIEEPVIIMETLHSCFAHALLDSFFPIFWTIQDLLEKGYISSSKNVRIFILENNVRSYPVQNLPLIDVENSTYKGVFKSIIEMLTPHPVIFEHLLGKKIVMKQAFMYPENDKWQRSIWNCIDYYPGRNVLKQDIRFPDEKIMSIVKKFRKHVFEKYRMETKNDVESNDLIIIDRKYNRKIDQVLLEKIVEEAKKNTKWRYKGIFFLEDLLLEEQIRLFHNTKYIVMRHGSSLANLIWGQPKSLVFELSGGPDGGIVASTMYNRLCQMVDLTHFVYDYTTINPKDIFENILKNNHFSLPFLETEKVSVIIPSYNRFSKLLNAIESIHKQTYKNLEIIVVNDCSTEREYYEYPFEEKNIKIIHLEKNSKDIYGFGCPQRNHGMKIATGKFIAFCDDDDLWFPRKIELQIEAMKRTGCKMSCSEGLIGHGIYNENICYKRYNGEHHYKTLQDIYRSKGSSLLDNGFPEIWNYEFVDIHNCLITSSVIIEKEIIDQTGEFIMCSYAEDYDYWKRALKYTNIVYVNDICFYYDD